MTMGGVIGGTVHSTSGCFLELKNLYSSSKFQLTLGKVDLKLSATDAKCLSNRSARPFLSAKQLAPSRRMPGHHQLFISTEAGELNALVP